MAKHFTSLQDRSITSRPTHSSPQRSLHLCLSSLTSGATAAGHVLRGSAAQYLWGCGTRRYISTVCGSKANTVAKLTSKYHSIRLWIYLTPTQMSTSIVELGQACPRAPITRSLPTQDTDPSANPRPRPPVPRLAAPAFLRSRRLQRARRHCCASNDTFNSK